MPESLFPDNRSGAIISPCGKYRYRLWRIWDETKPYVLWIMHNPSTADEVDNDPTIRRVIGFTKSWGYGGFYVGNLSPYRATKPAELKRLPFEVLCPFTNLSHTNVMMRLCRLHILAYGNPIVKAMAPDNLDDHWHYLELTKQGHPAHPLYLKSDLKPIKFNSL